MSTEIKNKIQELKNLRDKATVGPWLYSEIVEKDELGKTEGLCGVDVVSDNTQDIICNLDYDQKGDWRDSAKFIAESANRWNDLLKCLEVACETLEKYEQGKALLVKPEKLHLYRQGINEMDAFYLRSMSDYTHTLLASQSLSEIKNILEK